MKSLRLSNLQRAIILVVLVGLSVALAFLTNEKKGSDIDRAMFKVMDSKSVNHVMLKSHDQVVDLRFSGSRWTVDTKWDADPSMITVFFATLQGVEARRPVAETMADSVRTLLKNVGTEVILSGGETVLHHFVVGGSRDSNVTWFQKAGDATPYEVIIPGYRVYVAGIVELDARGWRNKRIFDFNWRAFKSLKASYRNEPGFVVESDGRTWGIQGLAATDTARLNSYLDAVSLLMAKRFVPAGKVTDSLTRVGPSLSIEVFDVAGRTHRLDVFTPGKNDAEVWGKTETDWLKLDRRDVSQLALRKAYFSGKGER